MNQNVWAWKGRQGTRKRRRQASPQGPPRQHPGHHQAGHSAIGSQGWREAYQRLDLRGDPWGAQDLPRERHQGRRDVHRARSQEDGDGHGRGLRVEEAGQDPVRVRRLRELS